MRRTTQTMRMMPVTPVTEVWPHAPVISDQQHSANMKIATIHLQSWSSRCGSFSGIKAAKHKRAPCSHGFNVLDEPVINMTTN